MQKVKLRASVFFEVYDAPIENNQDYLYFFKGDQVYVNDGLAEILQKDGNAHALSQVSEIVNGALKALIKVEMDKNLYFRISEAHQQNYIYFYSNYTAYLADNIADNMIQKGTATAVVDGIDQALLAEATSGF